MLISFKPKKIKNKFINKIFATQASLGKNFIFPNLINKFIFTTIISFQIISCGGGSEKQDDSNENVVTGRWLDESGNPVTDANFEITIDSSNGKFTKNSLTNADGYWSVIFPSEFQYPSSFLGSLRKFGFRTDTVIFKFTNGKVSYVGNNKPSAIAWTLDDVFVEDGHKVVHLGDSSFSGSANSQLQMNTSGLSYRWLVKSVNVRHLASYDNLCFYFIARGIQMSSGNKNTISLGNAKSILEDSPPNGEYGWQRSCFTTKDVISSSILHGRDDYLQITSGTRGGSDYDDFEVVDFWARLENPNSSTNVGPIISISRFSLSTIDSSPLDYMFAKTEYMISIKGGYFPVGTSKIEYDWGDGSDKITENATLPDRPAFTRGQIHAWKNVGNYTITLTYFDAQGQILNTSTKVVKIDSH